MAKQIPKVTVAVSALNEGGNIANFINSVLSQEQRGFSLAKVLIISDGSTDDTVEIVKSFKSPKIQIRDYKERRGKSFRLNQIYEILKSDFLIQSDADVVFGHKNVIRNMIRPMLTDSRVGMTSGKAIAYRPETLMERAIHLTSLAYDEVKKLRDGNNKFTVQGRILAFRKNFSKRLKIPTEVIGNDAYSYFYCKTLGFEYRYVKSATVCFRSPQTLKDHIKQNIRFEAVMKKMKRYFPEDLVEAEFYIPKKILIAGMIKAFIKNPILSIFIFLVNYYCRKMANKNEHLLTGKWQIADSTKFLKN